MMEHRPDATWWPYLMDFGLAQEVDSNTQTSTGSVEGTPAFMAPEQARGETRYLDARADVYGLGATLYSALTGRPPFVGNSTDVLVAVLMNDPPRLRNFDPAIPPALETIVAKCLEKDPRRRYDSAHALAADLGRYLEGARIAARAPGPLRWIGRFAIRHKLLVASASTALLATLILGSVALRIRWQAAEQARLAQHLGQQITKMEWLLRSARQMPLHDLGREKVIVRRRMEQLHTELQSYGERSQGLAHYALGRGHMALHEYPEALTELEQAIALGAQGAEVNYARGFVLGKHFEQAIYEARLAGGGDWAKKQLTEIAPKYLTPAIASLESGRSMKLDAPQYLEGLIAYYQRDYDRALKQADAALREAPWLYEANKLAGDVHLDRAVQARDSGRYEDAEHEFARAVHSYQAAATVGQSDGEVYEGLAEAWVRQIEMAASRAYL
jgi:serine/threonine-protein kinase